MTQHASTRQPADRPLRLGIVGTGKIAGVLAVAIRRARGATLAAASSRRLERARSFLDRQGGGGAAYGSWRELCESADVDAVYIATPTSACEEIALAAAAAGKHVLAEKPFVDAPTVRRITAACREHGVAFLDATHFVHHPRTESLRGAAREELGNVLGLRASFFAPVRSRDNIRFDPSLEPTGVVGDLGWYCFRAMVEFLDPELPPVQAATRLEKDPETGAAVRAAGFFAFADGRTATWDCGFDAGAFLQDLDVLGTDAAIHLDDYVHDWAGSFEFGGDSARGEPAAATFVVKRGKAKPEGFHEVETPCDTPHQVLMVERLVALARSGDPAERESWMRASERTQELVDAAWRAAG